MGPSVPIRFSRHAREQMVLRGASEREVVASIRSGTVAPAKLGRLGFRRDFPFEGLWGGRQYATKRVLAIVVEKPDEMIVVTVYTYYF
jgi:hypothetical protein